MPYALGPVERLALLRLNRGPGPILDIAGGLAFYSIDAALRLGLFESLAMVPCSAQELADKLAVDPRGMSILLELLESLGYVQIRDGRYVNSPMTDSWMLDDSATSFKPAFEYYSAALSELWPGLSCTLEAGMPETNFYDWLADRPDLSQAYQKFMMSLARMSIPELQKSLVLPSGSVSALDIGGGHSLYSIALCEVHPGLTVTVFDSPYSRSLSRTNVESAGMGARIDFVEGDYFSDDLGSGYHAVMLFNVLHEHTRDECLTLIDRATAALGEGGRLILLDDMREKKRLGVADYLSRSYNLMFYHLVGGQTHSYDDIVDWLSRCGISRVTRKSLGNSGLCLVTGT
jgi:hypothetical protein